MRTPADKRAYAARYQRNSPRYLAAKESGALRAQNREAKRRQRGLPPATRPCPEFCECCGSKPNGAGAFHLDHDHTTGAFRGWLCSKCNVAIGLLGDNIDGLMFALKYLINS
jgi:hypothetical protein